MGQADSAAAEAHVRCVEDMEALRGQLAGLGLVALVGDGSVLPRKRWARGAEGGGRARERGKGDGAGAGGLC